jgi:transposase-like protein
VLVELGVVEQRYRAVLEVLDEGVPVTAVARRYGVARQTVHEWLRRYANEGGLSGLADRSPRTDSCPHQMSAVVEARVVAVRREHPGWGPSRIRWALARAAAALLTQVAQPPPSSPGRPSALHVDVSSVKGRRPSVSSVWLRTAAPSCGSTAFRRRGWPGGGRDAVVIAPAVTRYAGPISGLA